MICDDINGIIRESYKGDDVTTNRRRVLCNWTSDFFMRATDGSFSFFLHHHAFVQTRSTRLHYVYYIVCSGYFMAL